MEEINQFLPLLLIIFLIYYFIILPKKKKRKGIKLHDMNQEMNYKKWRMNIWISRSPFIGGFFIFLLSSLYGVIITLEFSVTSLIRSLLVLFLGGFPFYLTLTYKTGEKEFEKIQKVYIEKQKKVNEEISKEKREIKNKVSKLDKLKVQLDNLKELKVPEVTQFKNIVQENEENITKIGGDNQLFSFLKIDSFLKDYRNRTVNDLNSIGNILDVDLLTKRIKEEGKRNDLEKISENLEDSLAKIEGRSTKGFDSNLDNLFKLGENIKPSLEHQIRTLEFYSNMATTMLVFYLSGKKINYFEIHSAFEKLGVFDSNWQKNVLNKLNKIEIRLSEISNELTRINDNFIELINSNDRITEELKNINSTLVTGNLLSSINVYQNWRISRKISN